MSIDLEAFEKALTAHCEDTGKQMISWCKEVGGKKPEVILPFILNPRSALLAAIEAYEDAKAENQLQVVKNESSIGSPVKYSDGTYSREYEEQAATEQPVESLQAENKRLKEFIHGIFVQCLNDFADPFMGDDDESHVKTMKHCYDQINAFAQRVPDWGNWDYAGEAWQEGYREGRKDASTKREACNHKLKSALWLILMKDWSWPGGGSKKRVVGRMGCIAAEALGVPATRPDDWPVSKEYVEIKRHEEVLRRRGSE